VSDHLLGWAGKTVVRAGETAQGDSSRRFRGPFLSGGNQPAPDGGNHHRIYIVNWQDPGIARVLRRITIEFWPSVVLETGYLV
jgi:hypothetical protein